MVIVSGVWAFSCNPPKNKKNKMSKSLVLIFSEFEFQSKCKILIWKRGLIKWGADSYKELITSLKI